MNFTSPNKGRHQTSVLHDKTNTQPQFYNSQSKIYNSSGNLFSTVLGKNGNTPSKIQMSPSNLTPTSTTNTKRAKVITKKFPSNAYMGNSSSTVKRYFSPHKPTNGSFQLGSYTSSSHKYNINSGRKNYRDRKESRGSYMQFKGSENKGSGYNLNFRSPQMMNSRKNIMKESVNYEERNVFQNSLASPNNVKVKINKEKLEDEVEKEFNMKKFKASDFEFGKKLGQGRYGNVYMAREKKTNFIVAIKKMNKDSVMKLKAQKQVVREIKIHSYLSHENIIQLYGVFHDDENIYLILEYASDGEVYKELKKSVRN